MKTRALLLFSLVIAGQHHTDPQQRVILKPVLSSQRNVGAWTFDGSGSWKISDGKLILFKAGVPSGPIRRPAALAILKTKPFRRVTVEADVHSTTPMDVVRRDLDVVIGYESPSRFYYVHLAGTADDVHNGIFLVDHSDRFRIDSGKGKPQLGDLAWHHVRVERDGINGQISVFVDRSKMPVLEAMDTSICCGLAGFGSFDDTGEFRNITVSGFVE